MFYEWVNLFVGCVLSLEEAACAQDVAMLGAVRIILGCSQKISVAIRKELCDESRGKE